MESVTSSPRARRRACIACTSAKLKCTQLSDNLCERCARSGKRCEFLDLPKRKRKQRGTESVNIGFLTNHLRSAKFPIKANGRLCCRRVDALENTVESLKTQVAALAQGNTPIMSIASSTAATAPVAPAPGSDIPAFASTRSFASATVSSVVSSAGSGVQNMSSSERENTPDIVDRGVLTAYDADCLIQSFMVNFVPAFPFVSLDAAQTSLDLRHKYPFLFLCIVAVTMEKPDLHCGTLREEIMKQITFRLIKKAQRNMDLLRGLLVYCAWYQNHHHEEKTQVILSLQLCLTLCYDMDLERKKILTAEEQRAFLGTYWLSVGYVLPTV